MYVSNLNMCAYSKSIPFPGGKLRFIDVAMMHLQFLNFNVRKGIAKVNLMWLLGKNFQKNWALKNKHFDSFNFVPPFITLSKMYKSLCIFLALFFNSFRGATMSEKIFIANLLISN